MNFEQIKALNEAIIAKDSIKKLTNVLSNYNDTEEVNDNVLALTVIIRDNMKIIQKQLKLK